MLCRHHGNAGDFSPGPKRLTPDYSVLLNGKMVAAEIKEVTDPGLGREKALCLAGRLEALHLPFSSSGRLVRVLGSVVQALVLAVLNPGQDVLLGSG